MDDKEIKDMLDEVELPLAYFCFDEDAPPSIPYLIWYMPESNNTFMDGQAYYKKNKLIIELYVDHKDMEMEKKLENVLDKYSMCYQREEAYIQEEKMFVETYEMEV